MEIKEIWKDVKDYEGLYQVSNLGRVKSLERKSWNGYKWFIKKERILKPRPLKAGYLKVSLSKDGIVKDFLIHRLVAIAFIPNPNNLPEVNHKDENKGNNRYYNLEWCDGKYNINYGTAIERSKNNKPNMSGENNPMYGKSGKYSPNSKKIVQLTLDNEFIKVWDSISDAVRELGFDCSTISKCCRGIKHKHKGFKWMYYEDYIKQGEMNNEDI